MQTRRGKRRVPSQTDDYPVVHVSWGDAKAFCNWLSYEGRQEVPTANGGRVGIRLPCRAHGPDGVLATARVTWETTRGSR